MVSSKGKTWNTFFDDMARLSKELEALGIDEFIEEAKNV